MIDNSKFVMSKFITKEELLEAKCEAYKEELEKAEELLRKASDAILIESDFAEDIRLSDVFDEISEYFYEEEQ